MTKIKAIKILTKESFHSVGLRNGKSKISSMSNTRKIKALNKKCIEKVVQELFFVRNPHSKGEGFSKSLLSLKERICPTIATANARKALTKKIQDIKII